MTGNLDSMPLKAPAGAAGVPSDHVILGQPIPPIERIRLFNSTQWEEFVLEWADSLRDQYLRVEKCGGAGDFGRDIIATRSGSGGGWDNFQCKHYRAPLAPSDIWIELGKLAYYTFVGKFTYPTKYAFVAPQGAGNKLSRLLKDAAALKSQLIENWDTHCAGQISSKLSIPMDDELRDHLDALDFSIFDAIPPLRIIDAHMTTRWHVARFGGGLPARPPVEAPPDTPRADEVIYLRHLLDAYASHLSHPVASTADVAANDEIREHLQDSRREFYSAESLRAFSRDTLPPGEFERLQEEVHSGVADEVRTAHENGYRRVLAVVRTARALQLTAHALVTRLSVRDRGGICHQLANANKVRWVE